MSVSDILPYLSETVNIELKFIKNVYIYDHFNKSIKITKIKDKVYKYGKTDKKPYFNKPYFISTKPRFLLIDITITLSTARFLSHGEQKLFLLLRS